VRIKLTHYQRARTMSQEIDDDRVLVVLVFKARSRIGGVPMEDRFAYVSTLRSGRITRTETYSWPEQALETVGLPQSAVACFGTQTETLPPPG
jgi:ketosteroid isomerase-like protein